MFLLPWLVAALLWCGVQEAVWKGGWCVIRKKNSGHSHRYLSRLAASPALNAPTYTPLRPPALPLAVRSPYLNAWSSTVDGNTLNTKSAIFWHGKDLGWVGLVTVDGVSYEYLSIADRDLSHLNALKKAIPLKVSYDSQYSNFTFQAGPVELMASFLSLVLPTDLCRTSIPLSYLTVSVKNTDNQSHDVRIYNDIDTQWIAADRNMSLVWEILQGPSSDSNTSLHTWFLSRKDPQKFHETADYPDWGNFTFSSALGQAETMTYESGDPILVRSQYVSNHRLGNFSHMTPMDSENQGPIFAFSHNLTSVSPKASKHVTYTLGLVQNPVVQYLTTKGLVPLKPWWTSCYGEDIASMIAHHYKDLGESQRLVYEWENQLRSDVKSYFKENPSASSSKSDTPSSNQAKTSQRVGAATLDLNEEAAYYSILALSTRQIMGAYVLTVPPPTKHEKTSEPLMFFKEISSNGNVNTVDVTCTPSTSSQYSPLLTRSRSIATILHLRQPGANSISTRTCLSEPG